MKKHSGKMACSIVATVWLLICILTQIATQIVVSKSLEATTQIGEAVAIGNVSDPDRSAAAADKFAAGVQTTAPIQRFIFGLVAFGFCVLGTIGAAMFAVAGFFIFDKGRRDPVTWLKGERLK